MKYDRVIIGAGLYGLYAALYSGKLGLSVAVIEKDKEAFGRATYINQARVHMGYHYPRSLTTAIKSAGYFKRFVDDYGFCIHQKFDQIYATSDKFSWTNSRQFKSFCDAAGIKCDEVAANRYFNEGMCDGAFLTEEYTYDAKILRDYYLEEIKKYPNVVIFYDADIINIEKDSSLVVIDIDSKSSECNVKRFETPYVLNATYASVNQILSQVFPNDLFKIKYELCEIILCEPSDAIRNIGITVMDGPFFSIMPFGLTGLHSLTSVTFTPHNTSYDDVPKFVCQEKLGDGDKGFCNSYCLGNCNNCSQKPETAWPYMSHLADKYLKEEYKYQYKESLYSMKPILKSSEVDDSRPTAIRIHSGGKEGNGPTFISVLSGKINTVYDLDEYLDI